MASDEKRQRHQPQSCSTEPDVTGSVGPEPSVRHLQIRRYKRTHEDELCELAPTESTFSERAKQSDPDNIDPELGQTLVSKHTQNKPRRELRLCDEPKLRD
jgi:hypothetical protein